MADIYKKWLLLSVILLIIGANQMMYMDQPSAIFGFFIIPSIIFLDVALERINFNLAKIISLCFIIVILAVSITSLLISSTVVPSLLSSFSINALTIILSIIIAGWSIIIILAEFPNKFYILNAYNLIFYSIATILMILTRFEYYRIFMAFLTDLLIFNAFIICCYQLFNLDKISGKYVLYLPFYLITLGMVIVLITYFIVPNIFISLSHNLILYLFNLLLILFIILIFTNYKEKNLNLNFYHTLFYLCALALLITFLARGFLDVHLERSLTHLVLIIGIELLCCFIIFLFKLIEVHNRILRFSLASLVVIIIFTKILKDIAIFTKGYNLVNIHLDEFTHFLFSLNNIIKHGTHLLIGLLIITVVYKLRFPDKNHFSS